MRIKERSVTWGKLVIAAALIAMASFALGTRYWCDITIENIRQVDTQRAKAAVLVSACEATIKASECSRAKEQAEWALRDSERENKAMATALQNLFRGVDFKPSLRVWWKRTRLQPMTGILLFKADALPHRFADKKGFIFPHHAQRGMKAVYLGEGERGVVVFCLSGDFAGKVITFKPWQRFDRQGALVYHF